ncbi:hypothetical protein [Thermosinus carboxydivorans]|nr:hypothetical protein [Thermosinus carboxydivorans]
MPKLLLFIALCSFVWNYSIPKRYWCYEQGIGRCGRRLFRLMFLRFATKVGAKTARWTALTILFVAWLILAFYCVAVTAYFSAWGLKMVALFTAVLATVSFVQDYAQAYSSFTEWCYSQEDNVLFLAKGCWEIVLGGLVLVQTFLQM